MDILENENNDIEVITKVSKKKILMGKGNKVKTDKQINPLRSSTFFLFSRRRLNF